MMRLMRDSLSSGSWYISPDDISDHHNAYISLLTHLVSYWLTPTPLHPRPSLIISVLYAYRASGKNGTVPNGRPAHSISHWCAYTYTEP